MVLFGGAAGHDPNLGRKHNCQLELRMEFLSLMWGQLVVVTSQLYKLV